MQEAAARLDEALAVWPREDRRFDPVRMHRLIDRLRAPGQARGGAEVG